MHSPPLPLPLLSTSCLQSFASLFITAATSEDIFTLLLLLLLTTPPSPPLPSPCEGRHHSAAASPSSGSAPQVKPIKIFIFPDSTLKQLFFWAIYSFAPLTFGAEKCLNVCLYTAHYPIMGGWRATIDWV